MTITDIAPSLRDEREISLVVVATPLGPLAHAIDAYRQAVAVRFGTNTAHRDEAHCLLVRTYHDYPSSVDAYQSALSATVADARRQRGHRWVMVTELSTLDIWHGLEIESPALLALAVGFATRASAATGAREISRQDRLRLTLAADFEAANHDALSELAHRIVDPGLTAEWLVGLWQSSGGGWTPVWRERP
jgi:hypothetical protein